MTDGTGCRHGISSSDDWFVCIRWSSSVSVGTDALLSRQQFCFPPDRQDTMVDGAAHSYGAAMIPVGKDW